MELGGVDTGEFRTGLPPVIPCDGTDNGEEVIDLISRVSVDQVFLGGVRRAVSGAGVAITNDVVEEVGNTRDRE